MESANTMHVAFCACSSRSFIDRDKLAQLAAVLEGKGYEVRIVDDLCQMVEERSPDIKEIAEGTIIACYPRAVSSQLEWLGYKAGPVLDIRNNSVSHILEEMGVDGNIPVSPPVKKKFEEEIAAFYVKTGSDAWYPVIDKSRCTECGKCHDFCLFGVYTIEGKKVAVTNPQNCKNNCPACARMCPSRAIVFPKYEKSPINGGTAEEEVFDPDRMEALYNERLKYRLQQRRQGASLLIKDNK